VLDVVTGLWPLSQAVSQIGQDNVRVLDVVPDGTDPSTFQPDAAQAAAIRRAGLVVEMGAGLQPGFAAAAAHARRALGLTSALGLTDPYVWLNPFEMERAARLIERAMVAADPEAAPTFANGLDNLEAELASLDEDFESILGVCPSKTLVTVGDAFTILSPRYPVDVVPVDGGRSAPSFPDRAAVVAEVATVRRTGVRTVYTEPWFPTGALIEMQGETNVAIKTLDPLLGVPPGGWPPGTATYVDRMEADLGVISGALQCPNPADNT
jgi:ABC-type Zn uptake system ZnuABC Zn-binding protein ZnuA